MTIFSVIWDDLTICTTGALKQQCGIPFSCVLQPFAQMEGGGSTSDVDPKDRQPPPMLADVARCGHCYS